MKTFQFPQTASCRVVYVRDGVNYSGIMPTPKTQAELLQAMSARNAKVDNIKTIEPFVPARPDAPRAHPAMHRMAQYVSLSEK